MNDDWLFNGTPPPDPTDAKIEGVLAGLARERASPPLPERGPAAQPAGATRQAPPARSSWRPLAFTGAVLAVAAAAMFTLIAPTDRWAVQSLSGSAPCRFGPCGLAEGRTLSTDAGTSLELQVASIGTAVLAPEGKLTRMPSEQGYLLRLDAGRLDVVVTAPPREFQVITPSARVVDLGCAYALRADAGRTELEVTDGSVSLENHKGVAIVTAGSIGTVSRDRRPAVPVRVDAPYSLVANLRSLEARIDAGADADPAVLSAVLAGARPQDLFTLWHVLQRVAGEPRTAVIDTVIVMVPALADSRDSLSKLDAAALTALWQAMVPIVYAPREEVEACGPVTPDSARRDAEGTVPCPAKEGEPPG